MSKVHRPKHYQHPSGIEAIEISRHHSGNIAQALQYILRCGRKEGNEEVQELEKAVWFILDELYLKTGDEHYLKLKEGLE